jgi:tetratricopeptide (TPR) repeat protein
MRRASRIALVLLALAPSAARAQDPPSVAARAHFKRGVDHYKAGDFDAAVVELEAAIAIVDEPDFDYVLGQAERRRGRCERAIEAYRRFLRSGPPPSEVKAAEANIQRCEEEIGKPHPPTADEGGPTRASPLPPPVPPAALPVPPVPPPVEPPVVPPPGTSPGKIAGVTMSSVGAAALGLGVYLAVTAANRAATVNAAAAAHATWTQALQDDYSAARTQGTAGAVLLGVGGALAAAGVVVVALNVRPTSATPNGKVTIRAGVAVDHGGRVVAVFHF